MRKYRHVRMLVNQSILNVLLDFDWLLRDGFGYYPHGIRVGFHLTDIT